MVPRYLQSQTLLTLKGALINPMSTLIKRYQESTFIHPRSVFQAKSPSRESLAAATVFGHVPTKLPYGEGLGFASARQIKGSLSDLGGFIGNTLKFTDALICSQSVKYISLITPSGSLTSST